MNPIPVAAACAAFVLYTYLGYPLLLALLGARKARPRTPEPGGLPRVSLLIPALNEESGIAAKIANSLALDYPPELLEVVVVSDGSTDRTAEIAEDFRGRGVRLLRLEKNFGKMEAINRAWPGLKGEIVILTDATALFEPAAVRELAAEFADPRVGAVSGELILLEEDRRGRVRVDAYWRLEKFIRRREARLGSVFGATGAIWAIRRELGRALPPDTILDDVLLPLQAVRAGKRLIFSQKARARETAPTDPAGEFRRKVRTLAGNYQVFARAPWVFLPRYGLLLQALSHKLFRLLVPFALAALMPLCLAGPAWLRWAAAGQGFFYLLALWGWAESRGKRKPIGLAGLPFAFCLLNAAALAAAWRYFVTPRRLRWK